MACFFRIQRSNWACFSKSSFKKNVIVSQYTSVLSNSLSTLSPTSRVRIHSPPGSTSLSRWFSRSSSLSLRNTYFPRSNHSPPASSALRQLKTQVNRLPSEVILWVILGLNGVVYILWNIGIFSAKNGDPTLLILLQQNFILSWRNWKEGRVWTIISSCFSNQAHGHILMNALTFYFMAPPVLQMLGNTSFLALYLGGGITSSLVTLFANHLIFNKDRSVLGASGAIYAVISYMACVAPQATFLIFGLIPVPAWGCVGGLFLYDLFNAISEKETGVSEISHLAGILSGVIYFLRTKGRFPRI